MLGSPELHCIVIRVDYVEVRHGCKAPLNPAVNVEVIPLGIVLQEGIHRHFGGKPDLRSNAGQVDIEILVPIGVWSEHHTW